MLGTVYLIESNNKKYALKIEKILDNDLQKNNKSKIWREIDFSLNFGNKFPDQFIYLYDYDFDTNCEYNQKYTFDITDFEEDKQYYLKKIKNSKYCIKKIYSLIDMTLDNIINNLTINQIYSMIIQITYNIYLLHINNYVHGDIDMSNIGVIKTDNKFIKILDKNIPTFGYIFKLIDYGIIFNKKDISSPEEEVIYNYLLNNELKNLQNFFLKLNNIELKKYGYIKNLRINKIINEDLKIKKYDNFDDLFLYYLKQNNNKIRIKEEDIIYFVNNNTNYLNIINYYSNKLNKMNNKFYIIIVIFILLFYYLIKNIYKNIYKNI